MKLEDLPEVVSEARRRAEERHAALRVVVGSDLALVLGQFEDGPAHVVEALVAAELRLLCDFRRCESMEWWRWWCVQRTGLQGERRHGTLWFCPRNREGVAPVWALKTLRAFVYAADVGFDEDPFWATARPRYIVPGIGDVPDRDVTSAPVALRLFVCHLAGVSP